MRVGGDDLPPGPLCFKGAAPEEVEAAREPIEAGHVQNPLTDRVEQETSRRGMTTISFAIAGDPAPHGNSASAPSATALLHSE